MTEVNPIGMAIALTVLIASSIAFVLKAMVLAIALDRYNEAKRLPHTSPDFIVANDELVSGFGRIATVAISLAIGLTWTLTLLVHLDSIIVRATVAFGVLLQALIAVAQGLRAMLATRRLSEAIAAQQEKR